MRPSTLPGTKQTRKENSLRRCLFSFRLSSLPLLPVTGIFASPSSCYWNFCQPFQSRAITLQKETLNVCTT